MGEPSHEKGKEEDKPILLSIGYASCYWCRKMSHENYEDSYVASLMNRHFIFVKVDREKRPTSDLFYMEAARMFNQSAGRLHACILLSRWFASSAWWYFFPKKRTLGRNRPLASVFFYELLNIIGNSKAELEENGKNATANLSHSNNSQSSDSREWNPQIASEICGDPIHGRDDQHGEFYPLLPNFPPPRNCNF